jgi:small subunit ribosomal protein S13
MVEEQNIKHIIRVANVDLPGNKHLKVALRKIKGVGFNFAKMICNLVKIDHYKLAGALSNEEVEKLNNAIKDPQGVKVPVWALNRRKDYETGNDAHMITGTLGFTKENDLKRLKKIKSYRGLRHQKKLPVRGQRTKSNFRRSKGRVVGVKKKGK